MSCIPSRLVELDDLLVAAKVADTAHTTILELQQEEGEDLDDA